MVLNTILKLVFFVGEGVQDLRGKEGNTRGGEQNLREYITEGAAVIFTSSLYFVLMDLPSK